MAELLKKLEDHLNCLICLDTYTDPKQLQCNHVYCQQCLVRLVIQDQKRQLSLTCPNCRQVTPVPASGVRSLQPAFQINQFLEIVEEHKKIAASTATTKSVSAAPTLPITIALGCPEHGGKEAELYCETCRETICWECIMKGSKHHSHEYNKLNKAFVEQHKQEVMASLEPLEKQLTTIQKSLKCLDFHCHEITGQRETIEASIHSTIARLHETLDVRKTELISHLHKLTQAKLKSLAAQRDKIEITQAQLSSCLLFMREKLKTDNQRESLMIKKTIVRQVKKLTTTFQPDLLEPNTKADIIFAALEDFHAKCKSYGKVYASSTPDPSNCHIIGKSKKRTAQVGEKFTDTLQLLNSGSQPCNESVTSISCQLIAEITGITVRGTVQKREQGKYEISYQPTIKGMHQLHVEVKGQQIGGSPYLVPIKSPVEKLGTPILTISRLCGPKGIAINQKREILVTENSKDCVTVLSSAGQSIRSYGTRGSGRGQFKCPRGVVVDGDGNIIVADSLNERIQKFTAQGDFVKEVDTSGKVYPTGLTLNRSNGMLYVVDGSSRGEVVILKPDLSYYGAFGKRGSGKGQLGNPKCIACDSAGNVYVTDHNNNRVQVFTAEGKFLRTFGSKGHGRGDINGPCGIAIDSSDNVYVSEVSNHCVSVFTTNGQFVTSFGSKGSGPGKLNNPNGLAVDSSGVVYVCDEFNNRVQAF